VGPPARISTAHPPTRDAAEDFYVPRGKCSISLPERKIPFFWVKKSESEAPRDVEFGSVKFSYVDRCFRMDTSQDDRARIFQVHRANAYQQVE
jgi:hypothetical protein